MGGGGEGAAQRALERIRGNGPAMAVSPLHGIVRGEGFALLLKFVRAGSLSAGRVLHELQHDKEHAWSTECRRAAWDMLVSHREFSIYTLWHHLRHVVTGDKQHHHLGMSQQHDWLTMLTSDVRQQLQTRAKGPRPTATMLHLPAALVNGSTQDRLYNTLARRLLVHAEMPEQLVPYWVAATMRYSPDPFAALGFCITQSLRLSLNSDAVDLIPTLIRTSLPPKLKKRGADQDQDTDISDPVFGLLDIQQLQDVKVLLGADALDELLRDASLSA
uniref:Uncharacterized protein n=1 Tax=Octactis speculum TaxID=3111310 RepID=A0A7S2BBX0_9STRA